MASKTSFVTWKKIKSLIQTIAQTQLSEVLHMTNDKPILVRGDEDLLLHPHESSFWNTDFVGTKREIDFDTFTGMPKHLTQAETVAIFRAIKNDTTIGRNVGTPHVLWTLPIHACTAMTTTFFDRQLPHDDEDRKVRCILRALPNFHNKLGSSNIKVAVEYETGVKIHFAKCVVFLKDSKDDYFVVVQWYDAVGRQPFDSVSGLPQVVLRPPGVPKSYSVMPINSIVNGAIITRSENQLWVLLSPREAKAYEQTNNW
jgi:hypothetical protein